MSRHDERDEPDERDEHSAQAEPTEQSEQSEQSEQAEHTEQAAAIVRELLGRTGEALPRTRIAPVRRLAELAGSPQLSYPVIQVAGTNGKTSTSRAIESLLRAHGLRTGLFTSPHLIDFRERVQLDGQRVAAEPLAAAWAELHAPLAIADAELAASGEGPITMFEALAVLAFTVFADEAVDVAIMEAGLGGEWDATNIVDSEIAVFTPIDLDHTALLGSDVATIARTKARIISDGATAVSAAQHPAALAELSAEAERRGARLLVADRDFALTEDRLAVGGRQLDIRGLGGHAYEPVFLPLFGRHQAENAALASAAVEAFFGSERPIAQAIIEDGLGTLTSPGRLELIARDPAVYVDAAHNPHGAEALARALTESFSFSGLALVVGVLGEKDVDGVLAALGPIADRVVVTPVDSPRSLDADALLDLAERVCPGVPLERADDLPDALARAREWAQRTEGRGVLVAGSVLLAGEAIRSARDGGWGLR